jgi:hypothetical protein
MIAITTNSSMRVKARTIFSRRTARYKQPDIFCQVYRPWPDNNFVNAIHSGRVSLSHFSSIRRYRRRTRSPSSVNRAPPLICPPRADVTNGVRKQAFIVRTRVHARIYDILSMRAASRMDPVSLIFSNRSALPGPMAISPCMIIRKRGKSSGRRLTRMRYVSRARVKRQGSTSFWNW